MTLRLHLALPLAALLSACAAATPPTAGPLPSPRVAPAQAEAQARAADAALSDAAVAHDARAFASSLTADAVFVGSGGVSAGVAAVCGDWARLLAAGGPTLAWAPDHARSSGDGDLVVTGGAWTLTPADGGAARRGRYLTVWQREPDGRLRVALDASDTPLPPASSNAARRPLRRLVSADQRLGAVAGLLLEGTREAGGFLLVEAREGMGWRVVAEVGTYRPAGP